MNKIIVITGATGMIGRRIVNELCKQGAYVKIITANKAKANLLFKNLLTVEAFSVSEYFNPKKLSGIIEDTDAIINLAGANVGEKRWSDKFKNELYESRINITKSIVESIKLCNKKPGCLINASGVGIYGFSGDEIITEDSGFGNDFLAKLCIDWEEEARKADNYNVRVVIIRTGIVLDKNDGALKKLITPFKFFLGGHQGTGKQWFSWIHIDDIVNFYIFALENNNLTGALNGTSPNPVTNGDLAEAIGNILHRPGIFHVPGFMLKLAVGEFAENLLTGQRVYPEKAIESGFEFKFPLLKTALENILRNN